MDVVVAGRRSHRLLRAHGEAEGRWSSRTSLTKKIEKRFEHQDGRHGRSRPTSAPTARWSPSPALRNAIADIFTIDLDDRRDQEPDQRRVRRLRARPGRPTASRSSTWRASAATTSCSASTSPTGKKTQLTFGTHDDGGAQFVDADTLVFPSTAVDPNQPISPEVAKNGNIYNVWTLNLKTNELKQFTDALGGNVSPVVLRDENKAQKIAFVTYYKGEYGIHTVPAQKEPLHTVATADFGAPGPIIDFQPPLSHTLVQDNISRSRGAFEKLFLEGRPPVNVGVTSGGDFFGGTQVTFTDVLGDQQFNFYARVGVAVPLDVGLVPEPVAAVPVRAAGLLADPVLLRATTPGRSTRPSTGFLSHERRDRHADRARRHDLRHLSAQPLRAPRADRRADAVQAGVQRSGRCSRSPIDYQQQNYGTALFADGNLMPLGAAYVRETTVFREYGPLSGDTLRARLRVRAEDRQLPLAADRRRRRAQVHAARRPTACWRSASAASRAGATTRLPLLRRQLGAARLRLPRVHRQQGVLRQRRAALPADRGGADAARRDRRPARRRLRQLRRLAARAEQAAGLRRTTRWSCTPIIDYSQDFFTGAITPVYGRPGVVDGLRLSTAARPTASGSRPSRSASRSTSTGRGGRCSTRTGRTTCTPTRRRRRRQQRQHWLRKPKFSIWIGYDF